MKTAKDRRREHLEALAIGWRASTPRDRVGPMRVGFKLPWPPSNNKYWRVARTGPTAGQPYISEEAIAYRKQVGIDVMRQQVPRFVLCGRLGITVMLCQPDHRRRDLDNYWKAFLDAMKYCGVIQDDSDFDDERIYRGPLITDGLLHVEIVELPGPTQTFHLPLAERAPDLREAFEGSPA